MANLIDRIEQEVSLLPSNDEWCVKYTWEGKPIKNKQLKENVTILVLQCRERYEKGAYSLLEHLYTLFPIAHRIII